MCQHMLDEFTACAETTESYYFIGVPELVIRHEGAERNIDLIGWRKDICKELAVLRIPNRE